MKKKPLRLLLAEDYDDDAVLVLGALESQGFEIENTRVMAGDDFRNALEQESFDIILCDYVMPSFDALAALDILHESGKDIPLIIVSGTIGEVVAVEAMRLGAADYLLKDNLIRLGAAVDREVREAETRRQKRLSDEFSKSQSDVLEMILHRDPLPLILAMIARRVEALSGNGLLCSIRLVNPEGTHLTLGAAPNLPAGFVESLGSVRIGSGIGSCGSAAALGRNVIVEDISTDPDWESVRDISAAHGLRACWSVPVFGPARQVIGTMSVFHGIPHSPTPEELHWVESATRLISLAIERSRAAEDLHASETLLRIASEAAHIGGWTVDFPETRLTWSDQVCAIHEVPPGTSPGFDQALDFYAPEWRERMSGAFEKCLFEGTPFDEEIQIITAHGRRIWVRAIGEGIRGEGGTITRIQGAMQDITGRKHAEETMRADEVRYLQQRNALITLTRDTAPDGPGILNSFQRITEVTARTLDVARVSLWRYTADRQAIECLDLYHLESGEHTAGDILLAGEYPAYFKRLNVMELIAADDAPGDPRTREFRESYLTPHGITSMLDVPVRFGNEVEYLICNEHVGPPRQWTADEKTFAVAIANLVSLALESSEREQAEQAVLLSHQRFQSVAAATNDTIWDWNLRTDAFWWNDGFANLFGWAGNEIHATIQAWIRQIHPEDRNRVVDGIYQAIARGDDHWSDEYRFISNDGGIAHVLDRGQVIRDLDGKAVRMVGGMTDLTAHKAAEIELARSHRALQMLSSCNEMLIRTSDECDLLAEACRIAVEIGGYRMAWVGYAMEDERKRIIPKAYAGEELGYLSEIDVSWADDHSSGIGPAGQAVRTRQAVVYEDVVGNPAVCYGLEPARKRGYRSVVCLPLNDDKRAFGVLCLYSGEPHPAGADEIKMLGQMAGDLAFGIENCRSRLERQRIQEVVIKISQAVSTGTGSEFFELLARNMVEALGGHGGLIGRYNPADNSIDTLSFVVKGEMMENLNYGLDGTPCENVMDGEICVFDRCVQQSFPDDHYLEELSVEAYVGIPLLRQDGAVAGIMAVLFQDPLEDSALVQSTLRIFAARAAAEMDRQQSDARIREQASLLDKAQDAILVRDLDHTITYWNKSAERLYGWTSDEAVGHSALDLIYRDAPSFANAHEQTLEFGEWVGEMNQIDKHGRVLTIEGRWTLVRDENGIPESVFVINTDISEHRKLEQQFLRAQRLESIGTLAGGIAHDLNNILAPISMSIELLKMRTPDERSNELLDTIAASAKRGADMVGQVLSFARGMEGRRVEVHPRQLILEIESILRDTFLRSVELEVSASRDLWPIHGDPTQLHQVVLNLCVNARDAVAGGGKIFIIAENVEIDATFAAMNLEAKEGPHVCMHVKDTGEGIPPEIMDKIYDPFFTTKSVGKGTGLGLSTSLAIVKSHGGFIHTASEPGQGTVFSVYLPANPAFHGETVQHARVELPRGNGETVLIIDDEASIRQITQQTLEAFGYQTLLAADGQAAVSLYSGNPSAIDVVLTDMMMPVMDGPETIRRLMEIDPSVRIIAASGINENRDLAHLSGTGVKDFLPKPYTAETLLTCLKQVLAH